MSYFKAIRAAVVARLKLAPAPGAGIYSLPPANTRPPLILIGKITLEEQLTKDSSDGWYLVAVECWVQSESAAILDDLADFAADRLHDQPLPCAAAALSAPQLLSTDDSLNLDAPGGPVLSRVLTFRLYAQPHDEGDDNG